MESFIISNYKIEGRKKNFVNTFWKLPSSFRTLTYYFCAFQLNFNSIRCFQFSSVAESCPTLCYPMNQSMPGLAVHHQLPESTQTHVHWVGDAIQPSLPLSSPSPPALNFPSIRVFSNESALCIRCPKYWSFTFNISPSNWQPGLISFRMDWLDLLAVQGTLKSLLRHHSSKASILWRSALFDCSLITLWLLSDHSLITLWLLSDHFSITLWLLSDHSLITLWSLSDHSLITEL